VRTRSMLMGHWAMGARHRHWNMMGDMIITVCWVPCAIVDRSAMDVMFRARRVIGAGVPRGVVKRMAVAGDGVVAPCQMVMRGGMCAGGSMCMLDH